MQQILEERALAVWRIGALLLSVLVALAVVASGAGDLFLMAVLFLYFSVRAAHYWRAGMRIRVASLEPVEESFDRFAELCFNRILKRMATAIGVLVVASFLGAGLLLWQGLELSPLRARVEALRTQESRDIRALNSQIDRTQRICQKKGGLP